MSKRAMINGAVLGGVCLALAAIAAPFVETKDGKQITGTRLEIKADGSAALTADGVERVFKPEDYARAVGEKPAEWDNLVKLVEEKKFDAAAGGLRGIVAAYRGLDWDFQAALLLMHGYVQQGQGAKAVETLTQIQASNPRLADNPEFQRAFRRARIAAGESEKVEAELNEVIAKGSRAAAAAAQLERGDLHAMQNRPQDALLDYLRTVYLFEAQKEVQPRALLKAAQMLEKLRDQRADEFYKKLKDLYPNSPEAAQAK